MKVFYNEFDPFAAKWLRELMHEGVIPEGVVDERSIEELTPSDVEGFDQCHFFAGIGGWAHALNLAQWTGPAWTGSCPCQPLSSAGRRKGHADERHLWPTFYRLIAECRPPVVFGEQVASADGREWLAGVRADLEGLGYAIGGADLPAAGAGAPHQRNRLYWVADAQRAQRRTVDLPCRNEGQDRLPQREKGPSGLGGGNQDGRLEAVGHTKSPRLQGEWSEYRPSGERCSGLVGLAVQVGVPEWNGPTVAILCSDGPRRASAEPDAFPMAHGVRNRMGALRGSGNAIVPQVAAQFVSAFASINPPEMTK